MNINLAFDALEAKMLIERKSDIDALRLIPEMRGYYELLCEHPELYPRVFGLLDRMGFNMEMRIAYALAANQANQGLGDEALDLPSVIESHTDLSTQIQNESGDAWISPVQFAPSEAVSGENAYQMHNNMPSNAARSTRLQADSPQELVCKLIVSAWGWVLTSSQTANQGAFAQDSIAQKVRSEPMDQDARNVLVRLADGTTEKELLVKVVHLDSGPRLALIASDSQSLENVTHLTWMDQTIELKEEQGYMLLVLSPLRARALFKSAIADANGGSPCLHFTKIG